MATKPKKPAGYAAFESLLRNISQVPKREVDREIAKGKRRRAKAKKK